MIFNANNTLISKKFEEGALEKIRFDYHPMNTFINGTLEVTIEGVSFSTLDYYNLNSSNNEENVPSEAKQLLHHFSIKNFIGQLLSLFEEGQQVEDFAPVG